MSDKIAMMGFGNLTLFPILENTRDNYQVDAGFRLPWVQEMTRDNDTTQSKIYGDDTVYLDMKKWNGMTASITVAEMPLETFARLGFGEYDDGTETLLWNPQGRNLQFAATFRCLRADGKYRMMKMFCFTVNEVKESALKTKGEGGDIASFKISGTFTVRMLDSLPGEIHDGADLEWLETV